MVFSVLLFQFHFHKVLKNYKFNDVPSHKSMKNPYKLSFTYKIESIQFFIFRNFFYLRLKKFWLLTLEFDLNRKCGLIMRDYVMKINIRLFDGSLNKRNFLKIKIIL